MTVLNKNVYIWKTGSHGNIAYLGNLKEAPLTKLKPTVTADPSTTTLGCRTFFLQRDTNFIVG